MSPPHDSPAAWLLAGFDGPALPAELRALLAKDGLAGVILFRRNLQSLDQAAELIDDIHATRPSAPPLVCVDEEGGPVRRFPAPFPGLPAMSLLAEAGPPTFTAAAAALVGQALARLGVDVNFAPVADVDTCARNPIIGPRAFAAEPALVAAHVAAYVRALQAEGVAACAKHFPGHGDTERDSHVELPFVAAPPERLAAVELPPFTAAVEAGVASVMLAHVCYAALEPHRPASLSAQAYALLRRTLGFTGLAVTDDLEMGALSAFGDPAAAALQAAEAGADLLLMCHRHDRLLRAIEGLARAMRDGRLPAQRVAESARRRLPLLRPGRHASVRAPAAAAAAVAALADTPLARRLAALR